MYCYTCLKIMYSINRLSIIILCTLCMVTVTIIFIIVGTHFSREEEKPVFFRFIDNTDINSTNLLNLRSFEYVINTHCNANFLVWIVTSYAPDVSARSALRRAYSNEELKRYGIRRIFLLALIDDETQRKYQVSQNAIIDESKRYNDMIQGNFMEAYKNLTYKHVMGLKWATENCAKASFVMKMDHDIVLNLYKIVDVINRTNIGDNILMGYVLRNMVAIREPLNKWFVSRSEYPAAIYPDFLSGWLYVTTLNTAKTLINSLQIYPRYFWIDDLFITGIVREELNIQLHDIHEIYTTNNEYLNCCLKDVGKKFECDFLVGPNGGDEELQVKFKKFAKYCQSNCISRPREFSVNNTCIVAWHEPDLGRGQAQIIRL